jgi:hypothetical protein
MNAGRMEAEVLRDSMIYLAGRLDQTMGGQELENSAALTTFRRSLYYSVYPEQGGKSSLGELFDAPDALECYRRTQSIVPQQALALTNSDLVHQLSAALEARIGEGLSPDADTEFVERAFAAILCRPANEAERQVCLDGMRQQRQLLGEANDAETVAKARESLVRVLLNHNDFVTIR